jgi:hypothetical protein
MRQYLLLAVFLGVGIAAALAQDGKPTIRDGDSKRPLKERHQFNGQGAVGYEGVVTEIDKDTLTLDGADGQRGRKGTYKFHALDLHKTGEVQDWASGPRCYRWQDVKVGDTVSVEVLRDEASSIQTPYVIEICIRRRPGDGLPQSLKPKEDTRWKYDSFLNDIDNGEDKSDVEILKLFPPVIDRRTGRIDHPGGLSNEYKIKLTALRERLEAEKAKKDKDLKAAPPDKK